jgi:hypothetical protein
MYMPPNFKKHVRPGNFSHDQLRWFACIAAAAAAAADDDDDGGGVDHDDLSLFSSHTQP